ncbi:MAG: MarR family winged helix-turn-helix transcriptional regulator [Gemmatimonadales bacterium]
MTRRVPRRSGLPHRTPGRAFGYAPRSERLASIAQIVQGLRRIVKALHAYSQEVRSAYGLTGPQLWALKTLRGNGRMSTGRLAAALAVHQSSVSILVDRLETRGLVRRARGRRDRRFVEIELTPRGATLARDAPDPAQGRLLHALEVMPLADVRRIRRAVERLVDAMEAGDVQARFFFSED